MAIEVDGALAAEVRLGMQRRHAQTLLPALDFALGLAGVDRDAIGEVIVGAGPGSFTGVRIAGATAHGLVRALGIPLYAYSSLAALAAGVGAGGRTVCGLLDARRGEVYAACYRFPDAAALEEVRAPAVLEIEDLLRDLADDDVVHVGEGALRYRGAIEAAGHEVAPAHLAAPRASTLLWLRGLDPERGRVEQPGSWEPLYLRGSGAERGIRG